MNEVTIAKTAAVTTNLVTFTAEDGSTSTRDFGKKGLMKVDTTVSDTAIEQTYWLVVGKIKKLTFQRKVVQEESNALTDEMIIRGLKEFVGNSVAGVYSDKDGLHPEDFELGVEQAIAALESGVIPTREKADKAVKGLGDLIRAYTELRAEAKDSEGNARFTAEEASYETVKALILGSTGEENKVRSGRANVKAKIEAYKAERAIARAKAAGAQVAVADDADLV